MPKWFRYSYILDGRGSIHGRSYRVTVHSLFFCFAEDPELEGIAEDEAHKLYDKLVPDWFVLKVGEELETVSPSEARGIGAYYLHVLVNDRLVKKVHLRRRLRCRSFFDVVVSTLRGLSKWLGGF